MASLRAPSASFLSAFLPVARAQLTPQAHGVQRIPLLQQLQRLRLRINLLPAALVPIPSLLEQLWDGLLKAVPKKKTSHMKKRHRQMAGKALKDVTALNKCSACGRLKRAHVLCPYCVQSIKMWMSNGFKTQAEKRVQDEEFFEKLNAQRTARGARPLKWEDVFEEDQDAEKKE